MHTRPGLVGITVLGLAFGSLAAGCRVEGLAFREDQRVEILAPEDNATVTLPFTVDWQVTDFEVTGPDGRTSDDAGYFAVLVDVSPMPPGEDLSYFARDDESCLRTDGCPDAGYLRDRGVHPTTETEFEVEAIADTRPPDRPSAPDDHEITIVLLNGEGARIGESAFRVDLTVDRDGG